MLASSLLKEGPGLPIVFLHGFLGTSADWEPLCSYLPPCHCIGLDLPGHGKSPFVKEFQIPLPRFHLVGYSMGGRIAMMYAQKHPEQIASLTVISAHPGLLSEKERIQRLKSDTEWANLLLKLPIDEFLDLWYKQPIFFPFKPDLTTRREQNKENLAKTLLHYSLANQPRFEIDRAIVGERDHKFQALFKHPIVIAGAGHAVHLENPQAAALKIIFTQKFSSDFAKNH